MQEDRILVTAEVAGMLNVPVPTLRWWRHVGEGPRSFNLGPKKVAYKLSDVLSWLDGQYNKGTK